MGWRVNGEHVQRSKLRVDARKWLLSKIAPKQYGEKQAVEHSGAIGVLTQEQIDAIHRAEQLSKG